MPTYLLRTIDPALWAEVKTRAESDGLPLRQVLLALLRHYAHGRIRLTGGVHARTVSD